MPPSPHASASAASAGLPYDATDPELVDDRIAARSLLHQFNQTLPYTDMPARTQVLKQLLGGMDEAAPPFFEPPFMCDLGYNIFVGEWVGFGELCLTPMHGDAACRTVQRRSHRSSARRPTATRALCSAPPCS